MLKIFLAKQRVPASDCNETTLERYIETATLGKLFADEDDIEVFDWEKQRMIFSAAATAKLFPHWWEQEEQEPHGSYPESGDSFYVIMLGDRRISGGIIAWLDTMSGLPPACPLIYPAMMVPDKRLVLGIGLPQVTGSGEKFFKRFFEEGPEGMFRPVLGDEVKHHLERRGKLTKGNVG